MKTLDRHTLGQIFEKAPPTNAPDEVRVANIFCCQGAPLYPLYREGDEVLGLRCCLCGNVNYEVRLGSSLIHVADASVLKKANGRG